MNGGLPFLLLFVVAIGGLIHSQGGRTSRASDGAYVSSSGSQTRPDHVALHEARHYVVAKVLGGREVTASVRRGEGLFTHDLDDSRDVVTALLAGGIGDRRGCSYDNWQADNWLDDPDLGGDPDEVREECRAHAAKLVRRHHAEIQRVARVLAEDGSI